MDTTENGRIITCFLVELIERMLTKTPEFHQGSLFDTDLLLQLDPTDLLVKLFAVIHGISLKKPLLFATSGAWSFEQTDTLDVGLLLFHAIQDIYLSKEVNIA